MVCILIAAALSGLLTFVISANTLSVIRTAYYIKTEEQEYQVPLMSVETKGIFIEGTEWTVTDEKPEITIRNVDRHVDYVKICFSSGDQRSMGANLFWTNDLINDFSEQAISGNYDQEGSPYLLLSCGENVRDLKILLGKPVGAVIKIDKIILNPDLAKQRNEDLRKAISYNWNDNAKRIDKFQIVFVAFLLVLLPFAWGWENVFRKRWLIGFVLLIFLVANKYNGDSLSVYDSYIQPGTGTQYVTPIIGKGRHVRSDEWSNESPKYLSTQFLSSVFETDNYIIRGTDTLNQLAIRWYSFYNPFHLGASILRLVLGMEYAYSFKWYSLLVFTFLINVEFFLVLTNKKQLLSVACSCMIVLSSFYQWWGFPPFITAFPAIFVCISHFIESKSIIHRVLFAFGLVAAALYYALNLYPAWQVPVGYLMIPVLIWMIKSNWRQIRSFRKDAWVVLAFSAVLFAASVMGFLKDRSEYVSAMLKTIYPGKRFSVGGFNLQQIFNYYSAGLFPYKNLDNPSKEGMCISLFPIPFVFSAYYLIKKRFNNTLINGFMIYSLIILLYITVGFPEWLARYSLMSYSPGIRAEEIFSYSEVLLFASLFSAWNGEEKIPLIAAIPISLCITVPGVIFANNHLQNYMTVDYIWFVILLFSIVSICLICKQKGRIIQSAYVLLILFSILTGVYVRPITKGLDSIYSKPLYAAIQEIREKDPKAKWISQGLVTDGYLVASGAPCINSCNYYPNTELWEKLDAKGIYADEYNRFAYVFISFTEGETTMSNPQVDILSIALSYKDICKTDAKYIASTIPLNVANDDIRFDCIYHLNTSYIYEIVYPSKT